MCRWLGAGLLVPAVVLVAAAAVSGSAWADTYADAFDAGVAAKRRGDFAAAQTSLQAAIAIKPDSAEAFGLLALVQAYQAHYPEALVTVDRAEALAPQDLDIALTKARILAWSGRFAEADAKVATVLAHRPNDADALTVQGRIALYRNEPRAAAIAFARARELDPSNLDAVLGLGDAARAQGNAPEALGYYQAARALDPTSKDVADRLRPPTTTESPAWRVDVSATHSWLSRTTLSDWSEQAVAAQRRLGAASFVSAGVLHAHRFETDDTELSAGIDTPIAGGLRGALSVGATPNASFLPSWRVMPSASLAVLDHTTLLLETSVRHYGTGTVKGANLGATQDFLSGRASVTARFINSWDATDRHLTGWSATLAASPTDRLHLLGGFADAPESDAGIVANTRTWFAGASYDLTPTLALRIAFTREDRQGSYIRKELTGGLAIRF